MLTFHVLQFKTVGKYKKLISIGRQVNQSIYSHPVKFFETKNGGIPRRPS